MVRASEQASEAGNSSIPTNSRVSAPNIYYRSTAKPVSASLASAARSIEVRARITGAGPDEARPQSELVRVRPLGCRSHDRQACGAEEIHLCPNADHSIALAHPREISHHGVQLVVGSASRQPRVEILLCNLLCDAASDRVSNQRHEVRACGVSGFAGYWLASSSVVQIFNPARNARPIWTGLS